MAGQVFDADHLADGIFGAEELLAHSLADDADVAGAFHVGPGERRAQRHSPAFDLEIFRRDAAVPGEPVLVAVHDLGVGIDVGGGQLDERHLLENGLDVALQQGLGAMTAAADAAGRARTGLDPHKVVAEIIELLLHLGGAGLADGDDADDGADADGDAQHGERASQLVAEQSAQGFADDGAGRHSSP